MAKLKVRVRDRAKEESSRKFSVFLCKRFGDKLENVLMRIVNLWDKTLSVVSCGRREGTRLGEITNESNDETSGQKSLNDDGESFVSIL